MFCKKRSDIAKIWKKFVFPKLLVLKTFNNFSWYSTEELVVLYIAKIYENFGKSKS